MDDQLLALAREIRGQIKRKTFFALYPFCSICIFKICVSIICLDTVRQREWEKEKEGNKKKVERKEGRKAGKPSDFFSSYVANYKS